MLTINGKVLVYTDIHYGKKQNSVRWLDTCSKVTDTIVKYIRNNGINNVLFLGDYFESRDTISVQTLKRAYEDLERVARNTTVYMIVGNHDMFNKNSNEISSPDIFKNIRNVHVIKEVTECKINGRDCLLSPYVYDNAMFDAFRREGYDMIFGHFDISPKFMEMVYKRLSANDNRASEQLCELIDNDDLLKEMGMEEMNFEIETKDNTRKVKNPYYWTDALRRGGTIFSGHIHQHSESFINERRIVIVGSPYQQTRGERESDNGFYILDEQCRDSFVEIEDTPKFIEVKMSDILKDIDNFDFKALEGNIVHKIYDVEIEKSVDAKITQRISDRKPYEELQPDYEITTNTLESDTDEAKSIKLMRKSKIDYLYNYIDNIEDKYIEENGIDRNEMKRITMEYYERTIGEVAQ